jgi:hypothetical protein
MNAPTNPPGWRPRFTLGTLLKSMLIFSILAAALGGLLRETSAGSVSVVFFVALVIAAPLAIMIGLSLAGPLRKLLAGWRRPK